VQEPKDTLAQNLRREERLPLDGDVTITISAQDIVGPGRNVSAQGVYFTTAGAVRVNVQVPGNPVAMAGELVRVESMGDGRLGIAVRFVAVEPSKP
jgi:hypothetical protein